MVVFPGDEGQSDVVCDDVIDALFKPEAKHFL